MLNLNLSQVYIIEIVKSQVDVNESQVDDVLDCERQCDGHVDLQSLIVKNYLSHNPSQIILGSFNQPMLANL